MTWVPCIAVHRHAVAPRLFHRAAGYFIGLITVETIHPMHSLLNNTVMYITALYTFVMCLAVQYSTAPYSIVQDSAAQYITAIVQYSAIVQFLYHSKGGEVTTTSLRSAGISMNFSQ